MRRHLLRGTLALTGAGIYARLTGSMYRIVLVRIVGDTGIGLFHMVLPIYALALSVATLGLPGALPKVVAERAARRDWPGVQQARTAVVLMVMIAALLTGITLSSLAGPLARHLFTDDRTYLSLVIMPLAVIFGSAAAVIRGYFEGLGDFIPSAVALVVEQTIRIGTILGLAVVLLPYGLEMAAAGAMAGVALGEAASLIALYIWYRRSEETPRPWSRQPQGHEGITDTTVNLLQLSVPLMLGGLVGSLTAAFDAVIIPRRLQFAGHVAEFATALYGQLAGMALPALFLPMVLTYPISVAIIPAIATAASAGNNDILKSRILWGTRLTLLVAAGASLLFLSFPNEISGVLYGKDDIAPLISLLAVAAPFTYVQTTLSSVLTGLGLTIVALRNYVIGLAIRLSLLFVLVGDPRWGIAGALWAITAGQAVMGLLHLRDIRRATGIFPLG